MAKPAVPIFGVALFALFVAGWATTVSPLTKVVALLEDLKKGLEEDGVTEAKLYNEYNHWCDSETMATKSTIADLKTKVAELNAFLQEQEALRDKLDGEIEEAGTQLAAKEADLKGATEIRNKEHADFKEAFQVYEESIDELTRSLEVLAKKAPGADLIQVASGVQRTLQQNNIDMGNGMDQHTLNSFFERTLGDQGSSSPAQSINILAPDPPMGFLQTSESVAAPQAVLDALQRIKEEQEVNRDQALKDEQAAKNNYEQLKASLEDAISNLTQEMSTKKSQRAESEEASAKTQAQLDQAVNSLSENETYLQEIVSQCQQKAREWKERTKLRSDEITAVSEAVQIMTSEAANSMNKVDPRQQAADFLQTGMRVSLKRNLSVGDAVRSILQRSGSPVLSLLASRVQARMAAGGGMGQPDPFKDVRKMIQEMVERLMQEAAEEAQKKQFCDSEMGKSTKQKNLKEKEIKKISSRIEEMEAAVAELTDELEQLSQTMAEMEGMTAEATGLRQREKAEALVAIKQYQDAQSLIGSAITVLQEFYSKKKSLVQTTFSVATGGSSDTDAAPPPDTWDGDAEKKEGAASGIIGLLEIAQSDFARLESETSTTEAVAEREYTNLMNENQVKKAGMSKDVEYKSAEKVKLTGAIQRAKGDLEGFQKELDAVNDYIDKLKPECTTQVDSFEERKARREQEIESLKEALQILEGNAIP